jgi:hypothetical protein
MEHSLPSVDLVGTWRRVTLVAVTVALVELVLLVALAALLLGPAVAERLAPVGAEAAAAPGPPGGDAAAAAAPKPAAKPAAAVLPRTETSVLVLNGNGRPGAASRAGEQIKGRGYIVAGVANAPRRDYQRTLVLYRPGKQAEAQRLAKDLGKGVVAPLDGISVDALMGAHVAVVLGP